MPEVTAPAEPKSEFMYMKHPEIDSVAGPIARSSFNALWAGKGWAEVEDPAVTAEKEAQKAAADAQVEAPPAPDAPPAPPAPPAPEAPTPRR